jgi:serine phosphatase RsbU (regulator of sigma subunit)
MPAGQLPSPPPRRAWSGLQFRMAVSYAVTTLAAVLLIEILAGATIWVSVSRGPLTGAFNARAKQIAAVYALAAAARSDENGLDPQTTFEPGRPGSIALSQADFGEPGNIQYIATPGPAAQDPEFVLLVAPDGRVLASSFPARYPVATAAAQLLPSSVQSVLNGLAGVPGTSNYDSARGRRVFAVEPVLNRQGQPIGAVYAEAPELSALSFIQGFGGLLLATGLFWLLLTLPVGGVFGLITTRRLVRRVKRLVTAADGFAAGDEAQRVPVSGTDEIGQLEDHFNQMAQQLVEGQAQRQILIEQNARQAERARMEQEMLTAQHIQQSLLPRHVPALPGWTFNPYYKPAKKVGGDFYDFLALDDGRLGVFIGDVAGKGVPAALVMATTRTMLRTAARAGAPPGHVLAGVNDLLTNDIPPGMFVTCFYALLEPASGQLRYANAGHELPYRCRSGQVSEVRATGMPLGIMPGSAYEEFELALIPGDCVLFHSDGLAEAHNHRREMFGLPRLVALLQANPNPATIIDVLLVELNRFTTGAGEQEDDLTLLTVQRTLGVGGAFQSEASEGT